MTPDGDSRSELEELAERFEVDEAIRLAELRRTRLLRVAFVLFAGCFFVGMSLSLHLAMLGLRFGTIVYGMSPVWPGHPAVFVVSTVEPRSFEPDPSLQVGAALVDDDGVKTRTTGAGDLAELRLDVPATLGAHVRLELDIDSQEGTDRVSVPLRTSPGPSDDGRTGARLRDHRDALRPHAPGDPVPKAPGPDAWQVALYPEPGIGVAGIDTRVWGLLSRAGQPVGAHLEVAEAGPNGAALSTDSDASGFFELRLGTSKRLEKLVFRVGAAGPPQTPKVPGTPATPKVPGAPETPKVPGTPERPTVSVPLNLLPAQLRLEVEPGPVVAPGAILKAHLATLPMKTPVRVDVWAGEVLVASHTDVPEHGALELETALPAEVRGLVRLEAYRILWDPAAHLNTAAVWVSDRALPEAVDDAWALLATLPGGDSIVAWASAAPPEARARLLSLALSRVGPERPGLPLLRSDLEERRLALQAEITRLRGHAHALMLGSAVVGLLAGAVWAVRHRAQTRRSLRAALAEGAAQGDDLDSADADPMTRMRPTYELVLVCVTVLLAIYGAWVVVSRIGWSF